MILPDATLFQQIMDPNNQDLIKLNYTTLVRKMTSSVAGHLFASNIITDEMRQQIEVEKTSYDRNRKLLSIILLRGPRAFRGLRMALMKANQTELSKLLSVGKDTMSEYERKLAMTRSLVENTVEKRSVENKPKSDPVVRQVSQDE